MPKFFSEVKVNHGIYLFDDGHGLKLMLDSDFEGIGVHTVFNSESSIGEMMSSMKMHELKIYEYLDNQILLKEKMGDPNRFMVTT